MNLQTIYDRVFVRRTELIAFLEQRGCAFLYYNKGVAIYRAADGTLGQLFAKGQLQPNLYDVTRFFPAPVPAVTGGGDDGNR